MWTYNGWKCLILFAAVGPNGSCYLFFHSTGKIKVCQSISMDIFSASSLVETEWVLDQHVRLLPRHDQPDHLHNLQCQLQKGVQKIPLLQQRVHTKWIFQKLWVYDPLKFGGMNSSFCYFYLGNFICSARFMSFWKRHIYTFPFPFPH